MHSLTHCCVSLRAFAILLGLLLVGTGHATAQSYTVTNLGSFGGSWNTASDINASGNTSVSADQMFVTAGTVSGSSNGFAFTLTRQPDGSYTYFKISNLQSTLNNARLASAKIDPSVVPSTPLPISLGTISPGSTVPFTLVFPASAGVPGTPTVLHFSLTYTTSINNTITIGGSSRITLP